MILDVITYPHPNLRQKCQNLTVEEIKKPETQQFITDLIETMHEKDGIGLAAIQVNKHWMIFTVATDDGAQVFINPKIVRKSFNKDTSEEGCLSVPDVYGDVKRPVRVIMRAMDRQANKVTIKASGLFARVIQHEIDHLNGILFVDKSSKITKGLDRLNKLKAQK